LSSMEPRAALLVGCIFIIPPDGTVRRPSIYLLFADLQHCVHVLT
jgi:hypothetical protein